MTITAIAIWIAFFSLLPIAYWGFRVLFDWLLDRFMPLHLVEIEFINEDGERSSLEVDVSNDHEFYKLAMKALNSGRPVHER